MANLDKELESFHFPTDGISKCVTNQEIFSISTDHIQRNCKDNIFKFYQLNGSFAGMDSRLLYYQIKTNKPKKIIEVGSGNSTLLMVETIKKYKLNTELICIEPYPSNFLIQMNDLGIIKLIQSNLQDVDTSIFESLDKNDILFLDSSHVAKYDSDVLYYLKAVLNNSGLEKKAPK